MKKYSLSILLVILVLLTLISSAYAETADAEVSAAETENIIITSDLDLNDRGTYQITNNTIVEEGVNVWFYGTELQIEPGVTLTILGNAEGDAVLAEGTLRVSGGSAYFRTNASFREEGSGKLEVDGGRFVELASDRIENNAYLNPNNMSMSFTNGGSVTFGYYVPSEQYMRNLLPTLQNSNPNVRLDLQFYSAITLSDDLTLPEHVTLHTDMNWSNGGDFTIPAGKTLTIPESGGLYAFTSAINIAGNLVNNGEVVLGSVENAEPYPTICDMTLLNGGSYSGTGYVSVETLENPTSYLKGFDAFAVNEIWREEGGRITYRIVDLDAVFEAFCEACDPENHPDYYDLNDLGEFTLPDSVTIPAGMHVDAWGTALVVPAGKTFKVEGSFNGSALRIEQGGRLETSDGDWANIYVDELDCSGTIYVGDRSDLNLNASAWNDSLAAKLVFGVEEARVRLNTYSSKDDEFQNALQTLQHLSVPDSIAGHVTKNLDINYPCTLGDSSWIQNGIDYYVHNNSGDRTGSLTIPAGMTVNLNPGDSICTYGAEFTVRGTLINNGRISLEPGDDDNWETVASLVIAEGGSYSGGGTVEVCAPENPKSHIQGVSSARILQVWNDEWSNWSGYRILSADPAVIAHGSTFSFTTSDEGIFQNQYSCGILVTPQEDGLYSFTLSFANDPKIHWDEAWLGINGTDLQDQSFDTDEPASLVFSAMMYSGEGYELVFSNLAKLNAVTVNVSVSKASDGFTERLNAMAANPYQRFHVAIAAEDLTGLTALNVPINVTLDVDGELTIPSGLTVSCYGDFSVNQGGALHIPEGAMLNLIPDADWRTYGCVILDGGTLDAAANTMSFEGRSCVQLTNRNYETPQAVLNSAAGVEISNISLEVGVFNQDDYEYWYNVKASGYKDANLILLNGFHLTLSSDLPEGYCLVVNEGATVTVPDGTDAVLYGYIAMEGGGFTNNGLLTVDETAGINIWADGSQVTNNGTINLNGSIQSGNAFALTNNGDFTVMNAQAIPAKITFSPNLYHYPNEHRLVLPASLTSIETEAFANTAAWEVDLPDGIGSIGDGAFANADDLFLVVIPNGNASITGNPFQGSGNVTIVAPAPGTVETFATNAQIPFLPLQ